MLSFCIKSQEFENKSTKLLSQFYLYSSTVRNFFFLNKQAIFHAEIISL